MIVLEVDELEKNIKRTDQIKESVENFSDNIADAALNSIKKGREGAAFIDAAKNALGLRSEDDVKKKLAAHLTSHLVAEIDIRQNANRIENTKVTIEADKLREKQPESLVYIKMRISEEGMEWQTMENAEGERVSKLMPE